MDNNKLMVFNSKEFGDVRTVIINNKPYFAGSDIAKILGYKEPHKAVSRHCKGGIKHPIPTNSGIQQMNLISEGDIYRLVMNSKLPEAEKFEAWVVDEVLPTIRQNGAYLTPEKIEEVLTDPDTIIKLAIQLKEERSRRIEAEKLTKQIAISENSLLVREVAKIASKNDIKIGEKRLWGKLREWGLILKDKTEPAQEYIDRGYFEIKLGTTETSKGIFTYKTTKVTGKGQLYIIKRLIKESEAGLE